MALSFCGPEYSPGRPGLDRLAPFPETGMRGLGESTAPGYQPFIS